MIDVSLLLVSFNTRELTLGTLKALEKVCEDLSAEIIVVDNASSDGSADAICDAFPGVTVARSNVNLGFARAVNLAAEKARGRYVMLLNPDIQPASSFVAELLEFADKHPDNGVYGGRTVREDGTDFLAGYRLPGLWSYVCFATGLSTVARHSALFNPEELPKLDRTQPVRVPALSGCLLMVNRELWASLGGFDQQYFMYSEDADLCYRATLVGAQPILIPAARVVHLGGKSSTSARKVEMLLKGKVTFLAKHWSPTRARVGRLLLSAGVALRAAAGREPWRSVWRDRAAWQAGWPKV